MSMMQETTEERVYDDGRTKQSFKDETDINKILARAAAGGTISHLAKHGAVYGDFTDVDDLLTAHARLKKGQAIFQDLPGELRREFGNDMGAFFRYVNDPANAERLPELLPGLAAPGNQLPQVNRTQASVEAEKPEVPASESEPAASNAS